MDDGGVAKGHLDRARRLGLYDAQSPAEFATQHVEILDAVRAGDIAVARTAMRRHLRAVFEDVERVGVTLSATPSRRTPRRPMTS
ncbi:FCD domain-containing protein [Amycolatopsis sp. NPDC049159]|uniref:FCD domain-containing protein n=1 Tax=Amycolatopsis sp. NPDC049159 TaxID=3157210 RepID=UPI0033E82131